MSDCFVAPLTTAHPANRMQAFVALSEKSANLLMSSAQGDPDARIDLLLATGSLVADQLMGRSLACIGVLTRKALSVGQMDVPRNLTFEAWLSQIRLTRGKWLTMRPEDAPHSFGLPLELAIANELPELSNGRSTALDQPELVMGLRTPELSGQVWQLGLEFDTHFIDSCLAESLLNRLNDALTYILGHQEALVSSSSLLGPEEILQMIQQEQGPSLDIGQAAHDAKSQIVDAFDHQVSLSPHAEALAWHGGALSYLELQQRSKAIACALLRQGVRESELVPIFVERSSEAYAAIIAILRCGAAYVPMDLVWPIGRIQALLQELGARHVVSLSPLPATTRLALEASAVKIVALPSKELDSSSAWESPHFESQPRLAYVMFTSGSTGAPKGVLINQSSILRLTTQAKYLRLDVHTRMLQAAPYGFDASTLEIWGPLLNGGCCVLHSEDIPSARGLARTITGLNVNTAWLTSSLFNSVVDAGASHLHGLDQLVIGGEALSVPHVRRALAAMPKLRLVNGYGPTESTTFACTYDIPHDLPTALTSIPIGWPITATVTQVLNHRFERIPCGFVGELMIGGLGLAEGYLGQTALNATRFVNVSRSASEPSSDGRAEAAASSVRLYRSGDRVRRLANGALEFLGRADQQIKLRGFRIELNEIDALLAALPGVVAAASTVRRAAGAEDQLVAFVVCPPEAFDMKRWRAQIGEQLPQAMVPTTWVRMDTLPLTANGKLDRSALPVASVSRPEQGPAFEAPGNAFEVAIAAAFSKVLGIQPIGAQDNFFEFGGSSLGVVRAIGLLEEALGCVIPTASFFGNPTPRGIASLLEDNNVIPGPTPASRSEEPIAIVGMALRLPGANSLDAFWKNLDEGQDSITRFELSQLDASITSDAKHDKDYVPARGVIRDVANFDAEFFGIAPAEAELMDPQQRVFLEISWECMEHAGYGPGADYWAQPQAGAVGVFAGVYNASYYQNHVLAHPDKVADFGAFQVMLANEKDYVATRVAHRLNLTGPAVNVFTACSTSLVAIAQAVDSLRLGRCRAALAGGASITCPPESGYLYQEGSMLSPDGKTRSFDAQAAGTVFSDGAAVIFLKRLSDAQADGDTIHALIRGVAVNNDGAAKASFTAPSVDGQVKVILAAQQEAGVCARDISYIEAHGTATPMGDPIEVDALRRAFASSDKCYLGSVKSNIGHTVMAAGAAGVIKTVLALTHEKLPKSLHFSAPNPSLRLTETPFEVLSEAQAWPRSAQPRIAGISSFGVGGTNAHLILQEAPLTPAKVETPSLQILKLSARTPAALERARSQLHEHLMLDPSQSLNDIAFTLDHGRKHFAHRMAVVASDRSELQSQLNAGQAASAFTGKVRASFQTTVFMFPGQGSQYRQMGWTLYQRNRLFREAMDRCFQALLERQSFDLKARLFDSSGTQLHSDALSETSTTQPALFAIEYALAQTWIAQGLKPNVLMGHSVGEFVAATLAGVMSLEDAVCLVARRGALMQSMPSGRMLAVRLAPDMQLDLPDNVSLAAENAPGAIVLAGSESAIEAYREVLAARGLASRFLETSHAFHSAMMEPAVSLFESELAKVELREPSIPIMSSATARWLTAQEAVQTSYWAQHLRKPVLFSGAVSALLTQSNSLFVELGPRAILSNLVRQQLKPAHASVAISTLGDDCADEVKASLSAAARLWTLGVNLELERPIPTGHRVPLPSYPFERRRFWLDAAAYQSDAPKSAAAKLPSSDGPTTPLDHPPTLPEKTLTASTTSKGQRRPRIVQELRQLFESVSGIDFTEADPSHSFAELGLDSLILTQVSLQIKRKFSLKITFRELMESYRSLAALAEHIDQGLPAQTDADTPVSLVNPMVMVQNPGSAPTRDEAGFSAISHARPNSADPSLTSVLQQQVLLMQQQLELLRIGASAFGGGTIQAGPAGDSGYAGVAGELSTVTSARPSANDDLSTEERSDTDAAQAQTYDVKKAFGAIARIHTHRGAELSARQRARLDALISRYVARTQASKAYTASQRGHLADPRVVNGFRPALKEIIYQIVVEKSSGAYVWDLDGNRYVDALNGFGMSLFGWQPPFVTDAIRQQLDHGYEIGPQHPLAGQVAQQICEMTGFERAAFCNTGSEAVMGALRVARTVTGRPLIVSFTGAYHGIFDEVVVRGTKSLRTIPAAPGIMASAGENVLVLEYGSDDALRIIAERSEDIAAVLVEPVQSRRPDFQPKEFLSSLRALTERSGIALIFDEIVTGFRAHPGGVQSLFGIRADMATYGKVIGGGLSIGVVAGKREFLDALDGGHWQFGDDSIPTVGVTYFAGTFVRHPLALAAAHAVLKHLKQQGPTLQEDLNASTAKLCESMNAFCKNRAVPIEVRYFASVWKVFFLEEHPYQDLLFAMMRSRGVHILDNFPCFMTTAHQAEDLSVILEAFKDSVIELQEATFIPGRQEDSVTTLDANRPPVPGARLGRNQRGQVAWFVESPAQSGKYAEIK